MKVSVFDPQSILYSLISYEDGYNELDKAKEELNKELTGLANTIRKSIEDVSSPLNKDDIFKQSKIKKIAEQQAELKQKQEVSADGLKYKEHMLMQECSEIVSEIVNDFCKSNNIIMLLNQSSVAYLDETAGSSITLDILKILETKGLINDYGKQLIIKYEN